MSFDDRPEDAWLGSIDAPAQHQPDMSGTYTVSFIGQAVLGNVAGTPVLTFSNQTCNVITNTTTMNIYMPGGITYAVGPALKVISFTNTQLTSSRGTDTGIANLQVIRPGFTLAQADTPTQVFDLLSQVHFRSSATSATWVGWEPNSNAAAALAWFETKLRAAD